MDFKFFLMLFFEGFTICFFYVSFLIFLFSIIEKKKHFINTSFVSKYSCYSFLRAFILMKAYDIAHYDKFAFPYNGIWIYEGNQGCGKTISMVHDILKYCNSFPDLRVLDNLGIYAVCCQNEHLADWRQIIDFKNGKKGVIVCLDELQNWFSCKQSKNFPPEMLSVVTQNRKNTRLIVGTAQKFYMLSKDIRTQATEVRSCYTFLGCITFYVRKFPMFDSEGNVLKYKFLGISCFVHSSELRECYDTYKVIESYVNSGFLDRKVGD